MNVQARPVGFKIAGSDPVVKALERDFNPAIWDDESRTGLQPASEIRLRRCQRGVRWIGALQLVEIIDA